MRVISWNMGIAQNPGFRGHHDQAWHYLLGLGPDLAFLQEALPPAWIRNEGNLVHGPFRQWGSSLFSPRFPLDRFVLPTDSRLRSLGSYLAFGMVSLPDGTEALVVSVHAVAREATAEQLGDLDPATLSRSSVGHPRINDLVFTGIEELVRGRPFIVAGDWNTARLFDSTLPGAAGAEFFARAREKGWFECVWEKLGMEVQTWFRAGNRPYQLDHVFCDSALGQQLRDVRVATEAASELRLSDHAPLIQDFEVPPISMSNWPADPP